MIEPWGQWLSTCSAPFIKVKDLNMNPSYVSSLVPSVASELRPEAKEFLQTLNGFLDCWEQMDAKYVKAVEFQRIRARSIQTDPCGIEDDGSYQLETQYKQQSPDGKSSISDQD